MDALAILIADHNRVRGLFARFNTANDADAVDEMSTLAEQIIEELTVHTSIEETHFYPWVVSISDETKETVSEGIEEHHVVKTLITEIQSLQPDQPEWAAKMTVLIENVEHHAEEEEEELFPKVRSATDADAREALGETLEGAKKELGAPVLADKIDLTLTELKELASDQQIPGRSDMDHDELAATVAPPTA
ncbi:MAG: hemerythrin domain-containing protein [Frankiaceae bacterium]|nr:hemerythrin domain-containing protein [Frankiaceae bacterium]MBV9869877.1 hemerythrin domain-containing protein [Frankiaceae bacterium]